MNVDYGAIGQRIKQVRRSRDMTQERLAEALSVSVGYISQIERGVTKINLDTLAAVAAHLNCELSELVTGVSVSRGATWRESWHNWWIRWTDDRGRCFWKWPS